MDKESFDKTNVAGNSTFNIDLIVSKYCQIIAKTPLKGF